jgi:hypothetical protein
MGRLEAPARSLGVELARGLPALSFTAPAPVDERPPEPAFIAPEDATTVANAPVAGGSTPTKKKGKAKKAPSAGGPEAPAVYVSERTILRLAKARAVPQAQSVAATDARPGGVQLLGVSALGVGMQDGDVITEVAGRRVRGEGDIVTAVLVARSQQAPTVSAVFYRGKVRGSLVVAMPYPHE